MAAEPCAPVSGGARLEKQKNSKTAGLRGYSKWQTTKNSRSLPKLNGGPNLKPTWQNGAQTLSSLKRVSKQQSRAHPPQYVPC